MNAVRTPTTSFVVVADDDDDLRELYVQTLTEAGFTVGSAANGTELVQLAQTARVDAFLIDLRMPEMDGWQAIEHVRATVGPLPYILVVSGHIGGSDMRDIAYNVGADDVIAKPITPDVVLAILRAALRTRS